MQTQLNKTTAGRSFIAILSLTQTLYCCKRSPYSHAPHISSELVIIKVLSRKTLDFLETLKALGNPVAHYLDHKEVLIVLDRLQ